MVLQMQAAMTLRQELGGLHFHRLKQDHSQVELCHIYHVEVCLQL